MDEQTIAAQVAQNITKEEHIPGPYETGELKPNVGESAFQSNVQLTDPAISQRLADYFDVSRIDLYNEATQAQMRSIYEWAARKANSTELDQVLPIIQMLENELGATFTTDKLQRIAKFIKLQKQSEVLRMQQESLYA